MIRTLQRHNVMRFHTTQLLYIIHVVQFHYSLFEFLMLYFEVRVTFFITCSSQLKQDMFAHMQLCHVVK